MGVILEKSVKIILKPCLGNRVHNKGLVAPYQSINIIIMSSIKGLRPFIYFTQVTRCCAEVTLCGGHEGPKDFVLGDKSEF